MLTCVFFKFFYMVFIWFYMVLLWFCMVFIWFFMICIWFHMAVSRNWWRHGPGVSKLNYQWSLGERWRRNVSKGHVAAKKFQRKRKDTCTRILIPRVFCFFLYIFCDLSHKKCILRPRGPGVSKLGPASLAALSSCQALAHAAYQTGARTHSTSHPLILEFWYLPRGCRFPHAVNFERQPYKTIWKHIKSYKNLIKSSENHTSIRHENFRSNVRNPEKRSNSEKWVIRKFRW